MVKRWLISMGVGLAAVVAAGPVAAQDCRAFGSGDLARLYQRLAPSVVAITGRDSAGAQTIGSGIIWDDRGHIVTNAHVVGRAHSLSVAVADGSAHPARLIGLARDQDLAVIAVAGLPGPALSGRVLHPAIGQSVLAIGNPFGLSGSLSTGIVAGVARTISGADGATLDDMIQTDAALNPGNSGGPLLDCAGRLVGLNTAVLAPQGHPTGIGFALAAGRVDRIAATLVAGAGAGGDIPVTRDAAPLPKAGIGIYGIEDAGAGIVVEEVFPGTAAAAAGSRPGDRITHVNGTTIGGLRDFNGAMAATGIGHAAALRLLRGGRVIHLTVRVMALS
ncbi:MAG: PDZ domain-containing protein [Candidatus Hydrogenedens sp.]|nr:PDZ domain-containing protein [Candidatus Hydrogenedens sp.]